MLTPLALLRIEGLVMLIAGVVGFGATDASWWWFFGLLLAPDLSMAGYLVSPGTGAKVYNAGHSLVGPGLLFAAGLVWEPVMYVIGSIWLTHIGMDRLFGYGLKYLDDFRHTHLGVIGEGRGSV
ncbi:MAG: DUF4260 domain-containing protein [Actinobacteria bacterium]|nr:DUF4260 domain-containing protein [Actinomycetota bacterium]